MTIFSPKASLHPSPPTFSSELQLYISDLFHLCSAHLTSHTKPTDLDQISFSSCFSLRGWNFLLPSLKLCVLAHRNWVLLSGGSTLPISGSGHRRCLVVCGCSGFRGPLILFSSVHTYTHIMIEFNL